MSHAHPHGPRAPEEEPSEPQAARDARAHEREHQRGAHAAGKSIRRLAVSLVLTGTVMIAEAIGGWLSGSLALVSDAGHMLTDAGALGLALVAAYLSSRPADDKRTFGYRRAEVLAAQINVGALFILSGWIAWEAVDRLRHPAPPPRARPHGLGRRHRPRRQPGHPRRAPARALAQRPLGLPPRRLG